MIAIVIMLFFVVMMFVWAIAAERRRMLTQAEHVLSTLRNPEEKIEFIRFRSARPSLKKKAMNSMIEKCVKDGWIYLKASEAPLKKTICSLGGGIRLHFAKERQPNREKI